MAIDAAGRRSDIAAVVADGTAAIGYHDIEEYTSKTLDRAPMWLLFKTMEVVAGRLGPEGLARRPDRRHGVAAPARRRRQAGEGVGRALRPRGRRPRSEVWYLPKASHTAALKQYPAAYEQRVSAFFDRHLGEGA